jgi:adenosylcobinamide-GDP ribazoletransferase
MPAPAPLLALRDIPRAFCLLSRLPMPPVDDWSRQAEAAWAYPLVGLGLGSLAALLGWGGAALGLAPALVAFLVLGALVLLSGAMHEDGLADTVDGFWGGWTRERRLGIMKDSQIGCYGVIALFLSLGLRWAAIWALWEMGAASAIPAVIAVAMLSRAAICVPMHALPNARGSGVAHGVGAVPRNTMLLALALASVLSLFLLGSVVIALFFVGALTVLAFCRLARHKIGGQTGDVLGATQQVVEITLLLCLVATLPEV